MKFKKQSNPNLLKWKEKSKNLAIKSTQAEESQSLYLRNTKKYYINKL